MKRVWLVEARKQKDMSQAKVAHAIGVAPVTYGRKVRSWRPHSVTRYCNSDWCHTKCTKREIFLALI